MFLFTMAGTGGNEQLPLVTIRRSSRNQMD